MNKQNVAWIYPISAVPVLYVPEKVSSKINRDFFLLQVSITKFGKMFLAFSSIPWKIVLPSYANLILSDKMAMRSPVVFTLVLNCRKDSTRMGEVWTGSMVKKMGVP